MGDFNAHIRNIPIPKVIGSYGEEICSKNGKLLRDFATFNKVKITNSFFRKKDIQKYTWTARGQRSIIDYIITNSKLAGQVKETRGYRGLDIGLDHFLVISTIQTYKRWKKIVRPTATNKEAFKVHLLEEDSIRKLYQDILNKILEYTKTKEDINEEWQNITQAVDKATFEVLGRKKKFRKKKGLKIWSNEIEEAVVKSKKPINNILITQPNIIIKYINIREEL